MVDWTLKPLVYLLNSDRSVQTALDSSPILCCLSATKTSCQHSSIVALRPQRPYELLVHPGRPLRLSHSSWALWMFNVQCCFMSTETVRTIRDWEPRTSTSTFTISFWALSQHTAQIPFLLPSAKHCIGFAVQSLLQLLKLPSNRSYNFVSSCLQLFKLGLRRPYNLISYCRQPLLTWYQLNKFHPVRFLLPSTTLNFNRM